MLKEEVRFIHLRDHEKLNGETVVAPSGGATIGYFRRGNVLQFTFAKCRFPDVFNKKIGRSITLGRLRCQKEVQELEIPEETTREQVNAVLREEYYKSERPHFAEVKHFIY